MFKYTVAIFAVIACAAAKPGLVAPLAYSSPLIAAPGVVTATSNQVIARNYNGLAAAPVFAAPLAARYVASPLTYSAQLTAAAPLAYSAPLTAYSAPLTAYSAPLGYPSAYGYASPLSYATGAQLVL